MEEGSEGGAVVILRTTNLTKQFGGLTAVDGVNLEVREGTIHSIIGPNGAGKTTLFNILTGEIAPTRGEIVYHGTNEEFKANDAVKDRYLALSSLAREFLEKDGS
jgi:branched-chain amino acid transport system ATP-binding protein